MYGGETSRRCVLLKQIADRRTIRGESPRSIWPALGNLSMIAILKSTRDSGREEAEGKLKSAPPGNRGFCNSQNSARLTRISKTLLFFFFSCLLCHDSRQRSVAGFPPLGKHHRKIFALLVRASFSLKQTALIIAHVRLAVSLIPSGCWPFSLIARLCPHRARRKARVESLLLRESQLSRRKSSSISFYHTRDTEFLLEEKLRDSPSFANNSTVLSPSLLFLWDNGGCFIYARCILIQEVLHNVVNYFCPFQ